jgi:hypothetical protein
MNRAMLYDAGSATLAEGQMNDTVAASAIRSIVVSFLTGGGEMAALINAYDWSSTPLRSLECWSQSLKTATAIGMSLGRRYAKLFPS